jgi:AdoMet-dependent heme synthase
MDKLRFFLNQLYDVDERVAYFKKKKQYSVEIETMISCNLSCDYCYASSLKKFRPGMKKAVVKKLIDDLSEYGLKEFGWIGGEPLLHKDWHYFMKRVKDKDAQNVLYTNGLLLTKPTARKVAKLARRVIFHVDSVVPETFREYQLQKEHYTKKHQLILQGLDNLLNAGFDPKKVVWTVTIDQNSYGDLAKTMDYAINKKKIAYMNLIPLFSLGRANKTYHKRKPTNKQIKEAFLLRKKIEKKPYLMKLGPGEYCKQFQLTDFTINWQGNVYPYIDYFKSKGNIHKKNIKDILNQNADEMAFTYLVSKDSYKNRIKGKCGTCQYSKYCFGNPTMTYNNIGKLDVSDPYCWLVNKV